jgi:hypothetical protein
MDWTSAATPEDSAQRERVREALRDAIRTDRMVKLPAFDPASSRPAPTYALTSVGLEPNPYGGFVGPYRYQFEGEEDLLHLIVTRRDDQPLSVEEARDVAAFLVPEVPPALLWLKPGEYSQHFYFGHDVLLSEACHKSDR